MATITENEHIDVLVRGAGMAGVQAALDLAESGLKVCLTDPTPALGGAIARRLALTGDASASEMREQLSRCVSHKNITLRTHSELSALTGGPEDYQARLQCAPHYVDPALCTACGACTAACPVQLPDRNHPGGGTRQAIACEYSGAIPHVFNIVKFPGPTPCTHDCPAGVNVQGFIALLRVGKIAEAYTLLRKRCPLPASSGRICRHHCEAKCHRLDIDEEAVAIRNLERYVADAVTAREIVPPAVAPDQQAGRRGRVAIIGGGPAGLTAASDLTRRGVDVTIFEAQPQLGGMLRYGIPAWRLPKDVLEREIQFLITPDITVRAGVRIAAPKLLLEPEFELAGERIEPFDAVLMATGAWTARKLQLSGENSRGVWQGLNFLYSINSGQSPTIGPEVVVLGGDDLALDAARAALRLPGVHTVHLACLESWAEMPADADEVAAAFHEGIVIHNGLGPTGFEQENDRVTGVRFRACTSVYDEHRSFDPIFDDTAISTLTADTVIVAAGRVANAASYELDTRPGGRIFVHPETPATTVKGIFAAGEAVSGPSSLAEAMAAGHQSAAAIYAYLHSAGQFSANVPLYEKNLESFFDLYQETETAGEIAPNPNPNAAPQEREEMRQVSRPDGQKPDMVEINSGYDARQALSEAQRCLECGLCSGCQECVQSCPAGVIDLAERPQELALQCAAVVVTDAAGTALSKQLPATGICWTDPAGDATPETEELTEAVVRGGAIAAEVLRQLTKSPLAVGTNQREKSGAALVIGAGVAGMTAARYIADQGFQVHLVEKSGKMGGLLSGRQATLTIESVPENLQTLEKAVRTHAGIKLYLRASVTKTTGQAGKFTSVIATDGSELSINHAVTVIATGGQARTTSQYLIGQHPAVLTQSRLGALLADGELVSTLREKTRPIIAMMQCVDSLTPEHPYCSRICCTQALGNALEIKSQLPRSEIVVLGGHRLTAGAAEVYYQQALERRIRFIPFGEASRPTVQLAAGDTTLLELRIPGVGSDKEMVIHPDLLVLATGIAPAADNECLAAMLDEKLTPDGFFLRTHPRLQPVDMCHEGVFICGTASFPCFIQEAAATARAVAARAAVWLSRIPAADNGASNAEPI